MKKIILAVAIAAAIVVGPSFMALGQDQSAATPNDVIFARKTLMVSIANNMMEIEAMTGSGKLDLVKGQAHADSISAMLMAFPHLFPLTTNVEGECPAGPGNRYFH
jgi:hypothetical protein